MTIEELNLAPIAKNAATIIKSKHPELEFTSGRRDIRQQAHAMAGNIVALHDRKWIGKTYLAGTKLQAWVDSHPAAKTVDELTDGLQQTMNAMPEDERTKISRHLTGRAFDIRPITANAEAIKADIRSLPGLHKFLEREGGHVRWHAQFN
jgi:hypothetical protein